MHRPPPLHIVPSQSPEELRAIHHPISITCAASSINELVAHVLAEMLFRAQPSHWSCNADYVYLRKAPKLSQKIWSTIRYRTKYSNRPTTGQKTRRTRIDQNPSIIRPIWVSVSAGCSPMGSSRPSMKALLPLNKPLKRRCANRGGRHLKLPSSAAMLDEDVDQHRSRDGR